MFMDIVKIKLLPFFPNVGIQKDMQSQKGMATFPTFYSSVVLE